MKIISELETFRATQEKQIAHYQSEKNNEMAYLVRWSILEKVVKTVTSEYRRTNLIKSLEGWLSHIKSGTKKPSKNPSTVIELKVLPQKNEFLSALNYYGLIGNDMWTVMDSEGKHRRHRNELAHTGKKFMNFLLYQDLMSDMEKLTNKLFKIIESNKANSHG